MIDVCIKQGYYHYYSYHTTTTAAALASIIICRYLYVWYYMIYDCQWQLWLCKYVVLRVVHSLLLLQRGRVILVLLLSYNRTTLYTTSSTRLLLWLLWLLLWLLWLLLWLLTLLTTMLLYYLHYTTSIHDHALFYT